MQPAPAEVQSDLAAADDRFFREDGTVSAPWLAAKLGQDVLSAKIRCVLVLLRSTRVVPCSAAPSFLTVLLTILLCYGPVV